MNPTAIFNFGLFFHPDILCSIELITFDQTTQATIPPILIDSPSTLINDVCLILLVLCILLWAPEHSHLLYPLISLNLSSFAVVTNVSLSRVILTFVLLFTIPSFVILLWVVFSVYSDCNWLFVRASRHSTCSRRS